MKLTQLFTWSYIVHQCFKIICNHFLEDYIFSYNSPSLTLLPRSQFFTFISKLKRLHYYKYWMYMTHVRTMLLTKQCKMRDNTHQNNRYSQGTLICTQSDSIATTLSGYYEYIIMRELCTCEMLELVNVTKFLMVVIN